MSEENFKEIINKRFNEEMEIEYALKFNFDEIVKKANSLGGIMYRGDNIVQQSGSKLGYEISYDCMEGFIAGEIFGTEEGRAVTRRSTYYSGILAWAGIVSLHRSTGQGSFITVNEKYRNI